MAAARARLASILGPMRLGSRSCSPHSVLARSNSAACSLQGHSAGHDGGHDPAEGYWQKQSHNANQYSTAASGDERGDDQKKETVTKAPQDEEKNISSSRSEGGLYPSEVERYASKARQESTHEMPPSVYDEKRTGVEEHAHEQAAEAERLVRVEPEDEGDVSKPEDEAKSS